MIITVNGAPGSGKDTFVEILLEKLAHTGKSFSKISMGNLRRNFAEKKGMTIAELNEWSVQNPDQGDKEFDAYLAEYGKNHDNFIAIARLGWYFLPHSLKLYIDVDPKVGAERIYKYKQTHDSRNEVHVQSIAEQMEINARRTEQDIKRFRKLYGIENYTDASHFDFVLDSTHMTPEQLADSVFDLLQS